MFQSQNGKKGGKVVILGYDLGHRFAQISYCGMGETEP